MADPAYPLPAGLGPPLRATATVAGIRVANGNGQYVADVYSSI